MFDWVTDIFDTIADAIVNAITTLIGKGLYYLVDVGFLWVVKVVYKMFSVFSGITKVSYTVNGDTSYVSLINVFLSNSIVNNIYWAMTLLGIVMTFAFTIIAIVKKMFDLYDKQQRTLGSILAGTFKSIVIMLLLSSGMMAMMNITDLLMSRINYIFNNASTFNQEEEKTYTNQQYATMARILSTIGNYSLNPSYNSRYNINCCFNDIRQDLLSLQKQGVFDVYYPTEDEDGNTIHNWQNVLQQVARSSSLTKDVSVDVYHENISNAILSAMQVLRSDTSFKPLNKFTNTFNADMDISLDVVLFLTGTTSAAHNPANNDNPSFTDNTRGAFYTGQKDMYSLSDVMESFDIRVGHMKYIMTAFLAYMTLKYLFRCVVQCASRIFTLVGMYIIAPPFIATIPADDGQKFKEWTTAFIIQCFGIFGTVIPMRLMIIFIPVITSSDLDLFPDSKVLNLIGKAILIIGAVIAVDQFGGIVTGILANNAGYQALMSGQKANAVADSMFSTGRSLVGSAAKLGLKTGFNAAKLGFKAGAGVAKLGAKALGSAAGAIGGGVKSLIGGGGGKAGSGAATALPSSNSSMKGSSNSVQGKGSSQVPGKPNTPAQKPEGSEAPSNPFISAAQQGGAPDTGGTGTADNSNPPLPDNNSSLRNLGEQAPNNDVPSSWASQGGGLQDDVSPSAYQSAAQQFMADRNVAPPNNQPPTSARSAALGLDNQISNESPSSIRGALNNSNNSNSTPVSNNSSAQQPVSRPRRNAMHSKKPPEKR